MWDTVQGHALPKRILQAHLASGRTAQAYLLAGPPGIGKRLLVMECAKALNCLAEGPRPCDACRSCGQIARGTHPDVHIILPTGAAGQIRIDQVRQMIGRVALRPFSARVQVVVMEGADAMTEEAANSVLKALEEPSASTRFFLTATQATGCLPTIMSRCQVIRCAPLPSETVRQVLVAQQLCSEETAAAVAPLAEGSLARAAAVITEWDAHRALMDRLASDQPAVWVTLSASEGRESVARLLETMARWLRDVAATAAGTPARAPEGPHRHAHARQAARLAVDRCLDTAEELVRLRGSLDQLVNPRLVAALAREHWVALMESTNAAGV